MSTLTCIHDQRAPRCRLWTQYTSRKTFCLIMSLLVLSVFIKFVVVVNVCTHFYQNSNTIIFLILHFRWPIYLIYSGETAQNRKLCRCLSVRIKTPPPNYMRKYIYSILVDELILPSPNPVECNITRLTSVRFEQEN